MKTCSCGKQYPDSRYPVCRSCWFKGTQLENPDMTQICNTCRFFLPDKEEYSLGRCRRHSPMFGSAFIDDASFINWPPTRIVDWCGDWERNK